MTTSCAWFDSRIEAYFTEKLSRVERAAFDAHRRNCESCELRFQAVDRDVTQPDPVIRRVFQTRLAQAHAAPHTAPRPQVWRLAFVGCSIVLAAIIGFRVWTSENAPVPEVVLERPAAVQPEPPETISSKGKSSEAVEIQRAKPGAGLPPVASPGTDAAVPGDASEFSIADVAGYSASLDTYKGKILLFAVVAPEQKEASAILRQLYLQFGANPGMRIVGVLPRRDMRLDNASFPVFYNQGSKLLGVEPGEFMLLDDQGKAKLRGPLNEANSLKLQTQFGLLGIQ